MNKFHAINDGAGSALNCKDRNFFFRTTQAETSREAQQKLPNCSSTLSCVLFHFILRAMECESFMFFLCPSRLCLNYHRSLVAARSLPRCA